MKLKELILTLGAVAVLAISSTIISSCNGSPNSIGPDGENSYVFQAYLLRDLERDVAVSRAFFRQNNQPVPSGPVNIDTTRLDFLQANGMFQKEYTSASAIDTGVHTIKLQDDGKTILNSNLVMTGDFVITVSTPSNRIYNGGGSVVVGLEPSSTSANANGYIFAAVKAGEEYTNGGWAGLVPSIASSGTFPPSVFQDTANNLITGLYYIYMYSFRGAPRIDAIGTDLPTVLPDSIFLDNLTTDLISGSFGTITVSRHDSIFVQQL